VITAVLIVNNRQLNSIGTINGERIAMERYRFMLDQQFGQMQHYFWQFDAAAVNAVIRDRAWNELVNTTVMSQRAQNLGLQLTPEQREIALEDAQFIIDRNDGEYLRSISFNQNRFIDFVLEIALIEQLFEHTTAGIVISEEEIELAWEEFREMIREFPNNRDYYDIYVNFIVVETEELANWIFSEQLLTMDLISFIESYCIVFNNEETIYSLDGMPIYFRNIFDTPATEEGISAAYQLFQVGNMSSFFQTYDGNWMMFQIFLIDGPDYDELFELFVPAHEDESRNAYFQELLDQWMEQATVTRNNRAFNIW
jgi:hypothetical protein